MVEREEDVLARPLRHRAHDVEHTAERILHEGLAARPSCEIAVELELEAGEAAVVCSGVAEHLRGHSTLRVHAALLRDESEPGEMLLLERLRVLRICLPLDVDEPLRLVDQLRVEGISVDVQRVRSRDRDSTGVAHLLRVGVDGRRLLADRKLDAHAVEQRSSPGSNRDRLVLLARRALGEALRAYRLEPHRPRQRDGEDGEQKPEEKTDAAIRLAPRAVHGVTSTKWVCSEDAGWTPSRSAAAC